MSDKDPALVKAYKCALAQYQPWHTPQWNSTGNDSFYQIISGGMKAGFLDVSKMSQTLKVPEDEIYRWESGTVIPDRKTRKRVWTFLKQDVALNS